MAPKISLTSPKKWVKKALSRGDDPHGAGTTPASTSTPTPGVAPSSSRPPVAGLTTRASTASTPSGDGTAPASPAVPSSGLRRSLHSIRSALSGRSKERSRSGASPAESSGATPSTSSKAPESRGSRRRSANDPGVVGSSSGSGPRHSSASFHDPQRPWLGLSSQESLVSHPAAGPRIELHPAPDDGTQSGPSRIEKPWSSHVDEPVFRELSPLLAGSPGPAESRGVSPVLSQASSSASLKDLLNRYASHSASSSIDDFLSVVPYRQGAGTPDRLDRLLPSPRSSGSSLLGDSGSDVEDEDLALAELRPLSPWRPFREHLPVPPVELPQIQSPPSPVAEASTSGRGKGRAEEPPERAEASTGRTVQVVDFSAIRAERSFLTAPEREEGAGPHLVAPSDDLDDDLFADLDELPGTPTAPETPVGPPGWRDEQRKQTLDLRRRLTEESIFGGHRTDISGRVLSQEEVRQTAARQLAALDAPLVQPRPATVPAGPGPAVWQMDPAQQALYEHVVATTSGRNLIRGSAEVDKLLKPTLGLYRTLIDHGQLDRAAHLAGMLLLPGIGPRSEMAADVDAVLGEMAQLQSRLSPTARMVLGLGEACFLAARGRHDEAAQKCLDFEDTETLTWNDPATTRASGVSMVPKVDPQLLIHALGVRLSLNYAWADLSNDGSVVVGPRHKKLFFETTLETLKKAYPSPSRDRLRASVDAHVPVSGSSPPLAAGQPADVTPEAWRMTPTQEALYARVQARASGRGLDELLSAGTAEADALLQEAYTLCADRYRVGDYDKAARLAGLLLLPRMGALNLSTPARTMGEKIAAVSDQLSPDAKVIFRLGHAAYVAAQGRPDIAAWLCAQHANAGIVAGLSDGEVRIHALRARLRMGHGLDARGRVQAQLQLAKELCLVGRIAEAQQLVGQSAKGVIDQGLVRESLLCIEVEADAAQIQGGRGAEDMQQASLNRAVKLYGIYLRRQRELRPELVQEELSRRLSQPGADQAPSPAERAALIRTIEAELDEEGKSVRERLGTFRGRVSRLAYDANVSQASKGDEELAKWARGQRVGPGARR